VDYRAGEGPEQKNANGARPGRARVSCALRSCCQPPRSEVHRLRPAMEQGDPPISGLDRPSYGPLLNRCWRASRPLPPSPPMISSLVETCRSRDAAILFAFPSKALRARRLAFLGLAALTRHLGRTITCVGERLRASSCPAPAPTPSPILVECHSRGAARWRQPAGGSGKPRSISPKLGRRRFRSSSQVAGPGVNAFPGQSKSGGQLSQRRPAL